MSEKIKGVVVLNNSIESFLDDNSGNMAGSQRLLNSFNSAGWDVAVVYPENVFKDENNNIRFKKAAIYDSWSSKLKLVNPEKYYGSDFLWARQVGENLGDEVLSKNFCDIIDTANEEYSYLLNPKGSTKYFLKSVQESLNLPFPDQYKINDADDLVNLVNEGFQLIAKPSVGWKSANVKIINNNKSLNEFLSLEHPIDKYVFQEFLPLVDGAPNELRINWIGDDHFLREKIYNVDSKGYDMLVGYRFHNSDSITAAQKEILDSAKEQTGMHMGSVDLRNGSHVIELNNAGIGLSIALEEKNYYYLYSLEPTVIDLIRQNVKK